MDALSKRFCARRGTLLTWSVVHLCICPSRIIACMNFKKLSFQIAPLPKGWENMPLGHPYLRVWNNLWTPFKKGLVREGELCWHDLLCICPSRIIACMKLWQVPSCKNLLKTFQSWQYLYIRFVYHNGVISVLKSFILISIRFYNIVYLQEILNDVRM